MPQVVEVVPTTSIMRIINTSGVEESTAIALREAFQPIAEIIAGILAEAATIIVTDESQKAEMKRAYDLRQELKTARVSCEKLRKELKEDSLKRGNLIQSVANEIKGLIEPAEEHLLAMEKFAERAEAARREKRKTERELLLAPYSVDTSFFDLLSMPDDQFAKLLDNSKVAHEARIVTTKKTKDDRIAAEQARIAEDARIREENAKLKAEAEALAKTQAAERAKLEAAAAAERAERERLQAEVKAKADAEAERLRLEEEAKQNAAMAPDKDKVLAIAAALNAIVLPECDTAKAKTLVRKIGMEIIALAERVTKSASAM